MTLPNFAPSPPMHDPDALQWLPKAIDTRAPAGPGWFESSRELLAGLEVIEESDNGFAATK
jgi:hypothetical protein